MNWWTWWLVWDFPAGTVCKEISYSLFLPQRSGSLYRSRLSSRDPIVSPPRVCGLTPPVLCCSVFHFKKSHPMVECVRESVRHVLTSACLHVCTYPYECVCSRVVGVFFSYRINCGSHVCIWDSVGPCGFLPPPPLFSFSFLLSFILLYSLSPIPDRCPRLSISPPVLCLFNWRCLTKYPQAWRVKPIF